METHVTQVRSARLRVSGQGGPPVLRLVAMTLLSVITAVTTPGQSLQVLAPQAGFAPSGSAVSVLIDPFSNPSNPGVFLATMESPGPSVYRLAPNPTFPSLAYQRVLTGTFNDLRCLGYAANDGTPNGTLYALGQAPVSRFNAWKVLRSLDGGNSWGDDGTFYLVKGSTSLAQGLTSDANGIAYACGYAYGSAGNDRHWIVRRKLSGTSAWSTVCDLSNKSPGNEALALCSFPGNSANPGSAVFAAGSLNGKWAVMRSKDQGNTWQQAGAKWWPTGQTYGAVTDLACDNAGRIYTAGYYGLSAVGCVVQMSVDGGDSWTTLLSDNSSLHTGKWRLATDNFGNVALSGKAADATGSNYRWVVIRPADPVDATAWAASYLIPFEPFPDNDSQGGVLAADTSGNLFLGGSVANWNGYTGAALLRLIP